MTASLKDQNMPGLFALLLANIAALYLLVHRDSLGRGEWEELLKFGAVGVAGLVGIALCGIINAQLSSDSKARIVFLRRENPLPGSEAFSYYVHLDPRCDLARLESAFGPLPTGPREQNQLWYRLYKSIEHEPAVLHAHRGFLFSRDFACLSLLMLFVLGAIAMLAINPWPVAVGYCAALATQFILALRAARIHARRLVCTVLARKSAEP